MAPTGVLAEQHHSSIRPLVDGISVPDDGASLFGERPLTVELLTNKVTGKERQRVLTALAAGRSEGHTSELQSLMRISYAVFCLKKTKQQHTHTLHRHKEDKTTMDTLNL